MSIRKYDPEVIDREIKQIKSKRIEKLESIKLHKMSTKKWLKARRKYAKKKIKFFSVNDRAGSRVWCDMKMMDFDIVPSSDPVTISKFRWIYSLDVEDAIWAVLQMYLNSASRLTYDFVFDFHDCQTVPVFKKVQKQDEMMFLSLAKNAGTSDDGEFI